MQTVADKIAELSKWSGISKSEITTFDHGKKCLLETDGIRPYTKLASDGRYVALDA